MYFRRAFSMLGFKPGETCWLALEAWCLDGKYSKNLGGTHMVNGWTPRQFHAETAYNPSKTEKIQKSLWDLLLADWACLLMISDVLNSLFPIEKSNEFRKTSWVNMRDHDQLPVDVRSRNGMIGGVSWYWGGDRLLQT